MTYLFDKARTCETRQLATGMHLLSETSDGESGLNLQNIVKNKTRWKSLLLEERRPFTGYKQVLPHYELFDMSAALRSQQRT